MAENGGGAGDRERAELSTWQEIADYLKVSTRAAQIYERNHDLPVHRLPGGRSRVWAYRDELDAWKRVWEERGRGLPGEPAEEGEGPPAPIPASTAPAPGPPPVDALRFTTRWRAIGLLAALLFGIAALAWVLTRPGEAVHFRVEGRSLIAEDRNGKQVWTHIFDQPLQPEWYTAATAQWLKQGDLDGNPASTEFVFRLATQGAGEDHSVRLVALTHRGEALWTFTPGRSVTAKGREFSNLYGINSFAIVPSRPGNPLVAFSANHATQFPNQVGVVNGRTGKLEREYWHPGHLLRLKVHDWDNDGDQELILAGMNVGRAEAVLVMLDPLKMAGATIQPEGDPSRFDGFPPGVEKAVVHFPRSCMAKRWGRMNRAARFSVLSSGLEVVVFDGNLESGPYIVFTLDGNLNVLKAEPSQDFIVRHHRQEKERDLDHPFGPQDMEALIRGVVVTRGDSSSGSTI